MRMSDVRSFGLVLELAMSEEAKIVCRSSVRRAGPV